MSDILDEVERPTNTTQIFSKLSFGMALLLLAFGFYFNSIIPEDVLNEDLPVVSPVLIWLVRLSIPISFAFSVVSFVKKEPSTFIKWTGGSINLLIAVLCVVVVVVWFRK